MSDRLRLWLERFDVHLGTERRLVQLTRQYYRRNLETLAG